MWRQRVKQLDRRIMLTLIAVLLVGVLATGSWVLYQRSVANKPDSGAQKHYTNAAFGYTVQYPAAWGLNESDDKTYMNVYIRTGKNEPGLPGFEITCADNPSGLTAEEWWRSHVSPFNNEAPIGQLTLTSGTQTYKSTGEGDQSFELYTMVHANRVCQLVNDKHGTTQVTQQAEASVNSFIWN